VVISTVSAQGVVGANALPLGNKLSGKAVLSLYAPLGIALSK